MSSVDSWIKTLPKWERDALGAVLLKAMAELCHGHPRPQGTPPQRDRPKGDE